MSRVTNLSRWMPIQSMPADRRDGRQVILWENRRAVIASWDPDENGWDTGFQAGILGDAVLVSNPELWADLCHPDLEPQLRGKAC